MSRKTRLTNFHKKIYQERIRKFKIIDFYNYDNKDSLDRAHFGTFRKLKKLPVEIELGKNRTSII